MKIAIITETFLPSTDGVVTRLCASIQWLQSEGHEVCVIAPDLGVKEFSGFKILGVPARTFFFYPDRKFSLPTRKVREYLLEFQPDLVHVVNPAFLGLAGVYYSRRLGLKLVASYHTNIPQYMKYYHLSFLQAPTWKYLQLLHNQALVNLCTSQTVQVELARHGFRNVQLWRRGVALERFGPSHYDRSWRERLTDGQPKKTLLLYVGRLASEKGIETIRTVLDNSPQFCLALVGDGPHRETLVRYFQGTHTVFTGFIYGEELAKAYASSDIFIFPSTTDTLGLVILEAMASGLPVIAADSGPAREQIEDGVTGCFYRPAQANGLNAAIKRVQDPLVRRKMGENARKAALNFSWEGPSRQLLEYYQIACNQEPKPHHEQGHEPGRPLNATGNAKH